MHVPRAERVDLRGQDTQVLVWGAQDAPRLFLLHGWMDVAASFQFLVDALAREWCVIAPDLRGFGGSSWNPRGYWFADYIADFDALVDRYAPGEAVRVAGHSLGANVAMHYAGVRPDRVAELIALDGFGIPAESAEQAPDKLAAWLDALADPPGFASYADFDAVARRLTRNDPRLAADRAAFLARQWAVEDGDGQGAPHRRSEAQAAVPDRLPARGSVRGVGPHPRAGAVGRRRGFAHPALARPPP